MKFSQLGFVVLFSFSSISIANAGLLIEPFAGYSNGTSTLTASNTLTVNPTLDGVHEAKGNGIVYGARAGYGFGPLVVGGEYELGSFKSGTDDMKPSSLSAFVEGRTIFGLSAMAAYIVSNKADGFHGNGGYKFGLGYQFLMNLKLNAEYCLEKYDDWTNHPDVGTVAKPSWKTELKTYQFTLSFPFEFGMSK